MKSLALIIGIPLGIFIFVGTIWAGMLFVWGVTTSINVIKAEGEQRSLSAELSTQVDRQLETGMSQAEVDAIVEEVAWRRYRCCYINSAQDVYIFGSRDLDLAYMLILTYHTEHDEATLIRIGTFEMYMLDSVVGSGCTIQDLQ
jgi:hypothetical protein